MNEPSTARSIDLEVRIRATPDEVWQALTTGEGLTRWFPPYARVEPGLDGSVGLAWAEGQEWASRIDVWEPGERLRTVDEVPGPDGGTSIGAAVEYRIRSEGGETTVRLVHSSFRDDDSWDDQVHALENGWRFFLWNLRHALERHPGAPRSMVWARPRVSGSRADVWEGLLGAHGLRLDGGAAPGDPFTMHFGGTSMSGTTILTDRPWAFAGVIHDLDDGIVHVEMEGEGDSWHAGLWISVYGSTGEKVEQVRRGLIELLESTHPEQGGSAVHSN